jgi:hypothetical protein
LQFSLVLFSFQKTDLLRRGAASKRSVLINFFMYLLTNLDAE